MFRSALIAILLCIGVTAQATERWLSIPEASPMPETERNGTAPVNGIDMYYAVYGPEDGTPVLLIHGGLAHGDIWGAQVTDLMADHQVIVADTRGHGRSTNDGSAYSYDLLAQDYLALLDYLEIPKAHLVGWSDGANIGFEISSGAPDRLISHFAHAGNVTLDGIDPSVESDEVFGLYVGRMARDYGRLSTTPDGFDAFLAGVVEMWSTEKPGGFEALAVVPVRTLVVQSEFDEAILMNHAQKIADTVPGASLVMLDDVSHFASFQAPDAYTVAIRAFLTGPE